MALIREAREVRRLEKRMASHDQAARHLQLTLKTIGVRRQMHRSLEYAKKVETAQPCFGSKLGERDRDFRVSVDALLGSRQLLSVIVLGERPGLRLLISVLFATLGVMAVGWKGGGASSLTGMLYILGAVVCESASILLNKRMPVPLKPLLQATTMTGLGLLVSLPVAFLELPVAAPSTAAIAAVVWYALVPTVGGFLLWYGGVARVRGSEAATFTAVAPLTAVVLAALVLGEQIGWVQALGVAAVILAILVLTFPIQAKPRSLA
ncbi:drug/metabolite transporter (DMT)-like permease [Chromobacterium alkanivorans]|nr:DMT family transporter [Chromobacterium alkanivorans]MCS3820315.1 drug/metabolite transporter (DMT)-like permease [Chromobacterium alkanivorans]